MLNDLNEKFDNINYVIKHKDPFPSFETAKSMLQLEETRLKSPINMAGLPISAF
ncbi:hypothetical protein AXX17_AT2G14290 [Arabidopsis thaliana]|jgi:hypothetical protein|nr:hypothetical protein AXX17_AT2G14290 [Arabidopsis thaliana]